MIGSDPAPAQRVNQVTAEGNNLQKRTVVTQMGVCGGLTHVWGWRGVDGRVWAGGRSTGRMQGKMSSEKVL